MEKEEIITKLEKALQERPKEFSSLLNRGYSLDKRVIDRTNFDGGTVATFTPLDSGAPAHELFDALKSKKGFTEIFPLGSNILNKFLIDSGAVYRLTDMWSISSDSINIWHLGQDSPFYKIGLPVLAKASFSEFKDLGFERFQSQKKSYISHLASIYILFKSKGANEEFTKKVESVMMGVKKPLLDLDKKDQNKGKSLSNTI